MCRLKRSGVGKDSIPLKYGMWFIDKAETAVFHSGLCFFVCTNVRRTHTFPAGLRFLFFTEQLMLLIGGGSESAKELDAVVLLYAGFVFLIRLLVCGLVEEICVDKS